MHKRRVDRLEVLWSAKLCALLKKKHGVMHFPLAGNERAQGWPDKLLVAPGFFALVEFKNVHTPWKPLQRKMHVELNKRNPGLALLVRKEFQDSDSGVIWSNCADFMAKFEFAEDFYAALKGYKELLNRSLTGRTVTSDSTHSPPGP